MSISRTWFGRVGRPVTRMGLTVAAAVLLSTGLACRATAADSQTAERSHVATPAPAAASAPIATQRFRESYADIVTAVAPAVVTIRVEAVGDVSTTGFTFPNDDLFRRFFGDQFGEGFNRAPDEPRTFRRSGLGSGVIVGEGYVLTNHHVIADTDEITVELTDGRSMQASLVGSDEPSDLALLKVEGTDLHALPLGDSDAVKVGDVVLAIGNPLGVGQTVTMGIISAKGRSTGPGSGNYEDFLQTDAPINHGNSGGALVNLRGELVGINSQMLSPSPSSGNIGIGFAIPSNMARNVMDQLQTKGRVTRAQLGVTVQPVTSEMARSLGLETVSGAIIAAVAPGSAADKAGLERGDVIEAFNDQPVTDTNSLRNRVAVAGPGSKAQVTVLRDGTRRRLSVTLDEATPSRVARDGSAPGAGNQTVLGVGVSPLTAQVKSRLGVPSDVEGLVVEQVDPSGRAAAAGIRTGDVIEQVDRRPVRSADDLRAAVNATTDRPLLVLINRRGNSLFLTVPQAD